jgi:CrcB protein
VTGDTEGLAGSRAGRARWTPSRVAAVALGGAVGAGLRWGVFTLVPPGRFPWPVLAANVVGSFVLGVVMAEEWAHPRRRLLLHDGAGIGFCGGLTTMSTFAVEVADLLRDGDATTAYAYVAASIAGGLLAVVAGAALLHRVRALRLPLEEEP